MRWLSLALSLCLAAASAPAGDLGAPLGAPSAPSLLAPPPHVVGKTAPTRLRSLGPAERLEPAGALGAGRQQPAEHEPPRPIERRLDCFETPVAPDRDDRDRFLSRCPANPAAN